MKVTTLSASLVYFLATTSAVSAYNPQPPVVRVGIVQARDANNNVRRHVRRGEHALPLERRAPIPQIDVNPSGTENPGNNPAPTESNSTSSSQDTGGNGNTSSSTTPPQQPPPTSTSSSSTPPVTDQPNTTPSTTSNAPQTSSTVTTTVNTAVTTTGNQGTTVRNTTPVTQIGTTRTASQGTYTNGRNTQTSSSATSTSTGTTTPFMKNKGAVAATAVVVSLVAVGALVFVGFWLKKKNQRGKMGDDTWDEASMKEFPPVSHHGAGAGSVSGVVVPPPLMTTSGGLGRSNTVLPSQSAGASPLARTKSHSARSHEDDGYGAHSDEPDEMLAMPPVKNYERPRDSAFDIVPPPPPAVVGGAGGANSGYSPTAYSPGGYNNYGYGNAYASTSASAGLEPPKRKGDHTSYGSGVGVDPFAGTGFVDATREAAYGQAGRGAGYSNNNNAAYGYAGSDEDAYDGNAVAGPSRSNYQPQPNQWGQAYNPYQGYGQASGSGSKGGYGGYGYAN